MTSGGRVLSVVGRGPDLDAARLNANAAADRIQAAGLQRRHDIAAGSIPAAAPRADAIGALAR
jgi:phosphoribosylamine--glycine ligase